MFSVILLPIYNELMHEHATIFFNDWPQMAGVILWQIPARCQSVDSICCSRLITRSVSRAGGKSVT